MSNTSAAWEKPVSHGRKGRSTLSTGTSLTRNHCKAREALCHIFPRITPDVVQPGDFTHAVDKYVHNAHWYNAELRRLD